MRDKLIVIGLALEVKAVVAVEQVPQQQVT
jgi:hypothetical protein